MFRARLSKPRYLEAIAKRRQRQPDLTEADWYREACDLLASRDLDPGSSGREDQPVTLDKLALGL